MLMLLLPAFLSFALSAFLFPRFIRRALRWRFVDRPGGRKLHAGAVPPVGGLLIIPITFAISALFGFSPLLHWPLYLAVFIILLTGVIDDQKGLSAKLKFAIHFLVAGIIVLASEARLTSLGPLFGTSFDLGVFAIPFSIACVVYLINAMNMMDGLDGLAGGLSVVVAGWFLCAALMGGDSVVILPLAALMGALIGFLVYNMRSPWRPRAIVFLGDAGSMSLGVVLAWAAMNIGSGNMGSGASPALQPIAVAFVLALPIIDAFALLFMRIKAGKPPFEADRNHLHHRVQDAGFTPGQASIFIIFIAFLLGGAGVLGVMLGVPYAVLTSIWIMLWLGHARLIRRPQLVQPLLARIHKQVFGPTLPPA